MTFLRSKRFFFLAIFLLTLCSFQVAFVEAWWLRPKPVCPLGYVEVRGCVPVDHLDQGSIRPPQPPPPPPPPPKPCPSGYNYSDVFGGCVMTKSNSPPKQPPTGASPTG